jgi:predicted RecA/RadA family phage recombinase
MTNYQQPGEIMEYSNSGSAIDSGDVVVLGDRIGIAMVDIAATTGTGSLALCGVYELASDTGTAYSQGDKLYWSGTQLTKTAAGNTPAGTAFEAKASGGTSAKVRLEPHDQRAANVAALAQDISATYSESEVQAISTKVDAILTALKNAGLMKNA